MESVDFSNLSGHKKAAFFKKYQNTKTLESLINCGFWVDQEDIVNVYTDNLSLSFYQRFNLSFDTIITELIKGGQLLGEIFIKEAFSFILEENVELISVQKFLMMVIRIRGNYKFFLDNIDMVEEKYNVLNTEYNYGSSKNMILADLILFQICVSAAGIDSVLPYYVQTVKKILSYHCLKSDNLPDIFDTVIGSGILELIDEFFRLDIVPKGEFTFGGTSPTTEQIKDIINLLKSKLSQEDFYKICLNHFKSNDFEDRVLMIKIISQSRLRDKFFKDVLN